MAANEKLQDLSPVNNNHGTGRATAFASGMYTSYFGGVKKLLSEYFSSLVIPEGMFIKCV